MYSDPLNHLIELHFAELIVLGNSVRWGFFYHSQESSIWYLWSSSQTQAAISNGDSMHDWAVTNSCPSSHSEWKPEPSWSCYMNSDFGFWHSYLFSNLDCFIYILSTQLLGGSHIAVTKLQIKSGYWITALIFHQTLQFRGRSVGLTWKAKQNPNANKMVPRRAS